MTRSALSKLIFVNSNPKEESENGTQSSVRTSPLANFSWKLLLMVATLDNTEWAKAKDNMALVKDNMALAKDNMALAKANMALAKVNMALAKANMDSVKDKVNMELVKDKANMA